MPKKLQSNRESNQSGSRGKLLLLPSALTESVPGGGAGRDVSPRESDICKRISHEVIPHIIEELLEMLSLDEEEDGVCAAEVSSAASYLISGLGEQVSVFLEYEGICEASETRKFLLDVVLDDWIAEDS